MMNKHQGKSVLSEFHCRPAVCVSIKLFNVTGRRKGKLQKRPQPSRHILIKTANVSQANMGGSQHKGDSL